eukprot:CAMPEP_0119538554 /NCGR_PEP_ID=MMETSP1344-20130328/50946_1 /TAXON_ID=236787 /ORGANISM="Florenciella parvula, Strain CCMP2471" /LENGTH=260 /DNA_ID=CAMNT_0007581491 /DNA_START=216 /DNA_END=998 /DNA_ORIENTATION=-
MAAATPEEEVGEVLTMETSSGNVQVRAVVGEPESGGTFIALGGLGRRGMGPDWLRAGIPQLLAESGNNMRVLLPDPYSCAKTRPSLGEFAVVLSVSTLGGLWRGTCKEKWLLDLPPAPPTSGVASKVASKPVVLAGHSYGGGAAARAAADNPEAVSRLVLVSPDVEWSVARRCWGTPTLLIWARDDYVNPYMWTSRWSGHPNLTIHTEATGGHMVLEKHGPVIAKWLAEQDAKDAAAAAAAAATTTGGGATQEGEPSPGI